MLKAAVTIAVASLALSGCQEDQVYTLYRNSPAFPNMRIHVATFDARDSSDYNNENCQTARRLFENQPGVIVRYWCERGFGIFGGGSDDGGGDEVRVTRSGRSSRNP
jgi:hypothetical protein